MNHLSDSEVIGNALIMWKNHIETGVLTCTVEDMRRMKQEHKIKTLEPCQISFVKRLDKLANEALCVSLQPPT